MKRRTLLKYAGASALASSFPSPSIAQGVTLRWWYHFDNPQNSPAAFVKRFEELNPGIKIQAEAIPWGGGTDYATRIFASAVAGNLPDTGLVRLSYLSQLMEMDALTPLERLHQELVGAQRHSRRSVEAQHGEGRQALLHAGALRRALSLLPHGPVPAGGTAGAKDVRGIPDMRQGADQGRCLRLRDARRRRAASTIGVRS